MNKKFGSLIDGNEYDKREFFRNYTSFFKQMGYDIKKKLKENKEKYKALNISAKI